MKTLKIKPIQCQYVLEILAKEFDYLLNKSLKKISFSDIDILQTALLKIPICFDNAAIAYDLKVDVSIWNYRAKKLQQICLKKFIYIETDTLDAMEKLEILHKSYLARLVN